MGVGEGVNNRKKVEAAANKFRLIAGQKASDHEGEEVDHEPQSPRWSGDAVFKVTLRKSHMYEFLDRLVTITLARAQFHSLCPKSFNGGGDYTIGD